MMLTFNIKFDMQDIDELRKLIKEQLDEDCLTNIDKQLLQVQADYAEERKKLRGCRDVNIMYYVNQLLEGNGPAVCYSTKEKLALADNIIRAHNLYIKTLWGEA